MRRTTSQTLSLWALIGLTALSSSAYAQNFGSLIINRKKIEMVRKLPPQGRVEGTTFKVLVPTAAGIQSDVAPDLKASLESILVRNDPRLRTEEGHADTVITCHISSYSLPQPQLTSQPVLGSKQNQTLERVTGVLTVSFKAEGRSGRSLTADNVTAKFDQEYSAAGAQQGIVHSVTRSVTHLTKGGAEDDTPPTTAELHNRLIADAAMQIASHLVTTTEPVEVYLAKGGELDQANKLLESKLWSRALEALETMKPFPSKEDDAYRIYNLGVVNEALAYQAEDVQQARKFLQEAAIDYGKAIDAKPTEKYFLQPQTRIDTALAHYKILGEEKAPVVTASVPVPKAAAVPVAKASAPSKTAASSATTTPGETLTNDQIISMVSAKLDQKNIIDTIQYAKAVNFDLSANGQVGLAKAGVSGPIITAMKTRSRGATATHRPASTAGH